jgi:hypothetical protein
LRPHPVPIGLGLTALRAVQKHHVFRALDGYREHPAAHVSAVADVYSGSNILIGAKKRIDGVTLGHGASVFTVVLMACNSPAGSPTGRGDIGLLWHEVPVPR